MAKLTRLYREKEAVKVVNGIGLYRLLRLESVAEYDVSALQDGSVIGTLYNNGLLDITGTGAMKNYTSSGTGASPFLNSTTITEIVIPNSVTTIGSYAFYYCTSLTEIIIPNSVTTIEEGAFVHCTSLTSVIIPNSVTTIGNRAFQSCRSLTSVIIPNSVTTIGNSAFNNCTNLTSVVIPNSVITIGARAFGYGNPDLILKPEALEKPEGWSDLWNAYDFNGAFLTVWWGGVPPQQ